MISQPESTTKPKRRILAQLIGFYAQRRVLVVGAASLLTLCISGVVTAIVVPADGAEGLITPRTLIEPLVGLEVEVLTGEESPFVREEIVRRGDTLATLLTRLGVRDAEAIEFVTRGDGAASHGKIRLRAGEVVTAATTRLGRLISFAMPPAENGAARVLARQDGKLQFSERRIELESRVVMKSGRITSSLFGATDDAGLPDSVAVSLAEIFGSEIDFHRDLRRGDRFAVIYEMLYHSGQPMKTGRILAAEFENQGRKYSALWFTRPDGSGDYYGADGKSLREGFLRSPLEFSRISSGFSMRFHPILKQWRAHRGVDYAAPTGTRVKATADGEVEFLGRQGGYGNMVVLRHANGYTTAYGHLSAFPAGIRRGSRVSQGQVIGYVGATGWATGPHLHYEFRVNGEHKDPLKVALPGAAPLSIQQQAEFQRRSAGLLAQLRVAERHQLVATE